MSARRTTARARPRCGGRSALPWRWPSPAAPSSATRTCPATRSRAWPRPTAPRRRCCASTTRTSAGASAAPTGSAPRSRCRWTTTTPTGEAITLSLLRVPGRGRRPAHRLAGGQPGRAGRVRGDLRRGRRDLLRRASCGRSSTSSGSTRGASRRAPRSTAAPTRSSTPTSAPTPTPTRRPSAARPGHCSRPSARAASSAAATLTRHVSTEEVARDLDVIRAVLGQEKLSYFGASYGTLIGATYADLFPDRVGRLVLDGAVDPTVGPLEQAKVQARGFETALTAYVESCVEPTTATSAATSTPASPGSASCSTTSTASPLPAGDGDRLLTEGRAVYGIWAPLYDESYWGLLDSAVGVRARGRRHRAAAPRATPTPRAGRRATSTTPSRRWSRSTAWTGPAGCRPREARRAAPRGGGGLADLRADLRPRSHRLPRLAGADRQRAGAADRRGVRPDPGRGHQPRPGHAAGVGRGPGPPARRAGCWCAATATATPATGPATSASTTPWSATWSPAPSPTAPSTAEARRSARRRTGRVPPVRVGTPLS